MSAVGRSRRTISIMASKRRNPTLSEIAKVAGVSTMTASRALNNQPGVSVEKREEILRISEDLGYVANRVAQRLSGGRSHIVGVIAQLHTNFTSELVLGIGSAGRAANYEMLVYSISESSHEPPWAVIDLLGQIADGVVIILPFEGEYLSRLSDIHLPVVTIDEGPPLPFPKVVVDNYEGAKMAMQHLASLGHRRIGFIAGDARLASARERLRAFNDSRPQLGLDADPGLVADGNFMQLGGFSAAKKLLALSPRPTAIFAANDVSAVGALSAIQASGLRVPEDISLVGFDDVSVSTQVYPHLTTIRQPLAQMSRAAINMLVAMISGFEPPAQKITLSPELVVRDSTGPAPVRKAQGKERANSTA